jgi:broad specificity phosphatase PhoE
MVVGVLFVLVGCWHGTTTFGLSFHQSSRPLTRFLSHDDPTRLCLASDSSADEAAVAAAWHKDPAWVRPVYPAMDGKFRVQNSLSGRVDPSINYSRRHVLSALAASSVVLAHPAYGGAAATADLVPTDCLADLPPLDMSHVRLYLCRHGETEYNRLQIVQGARVDAPLNDMGRQQAVLLGQALGRAAVTPNLFVHSPLQRAQTTAQLAASASTASAAQSSTPWLYSKPPPQRTLRRLNSLSEVDFGVGAEGMPVANKRAELVALYTAWALGDLDARMNGSDGESGRQVRVCTSKMSL